MDLELFRRALEPSTEGGRRLPERLVARWRGTIDRLLLLGGSSEGNQVTVFFDGDGAFDAMLAAIHSARRRVWLETYILANDRLGRSVLDALHEAAGRGVDVILLYDVVGSSGLPDEVISPLIRRGVRVIGFNPPRWFSRPLPLLMRDHRKILIVDDVGFCGGMNITQDYGGPRRGNGRFRDTHALLEGPGVADLAAIFASSLLTATREAPAIGAPTPPLSEGVFCQVLGSDMVLRRRHIQRALYRTIGHCMRTCYLTSPYFVPPPRLLTSLVRAARRGVDVRVLTAGLSDVPVAAAAARHIYGGLLRGGVRVFEMVDRTLHAKTAAIDGLYASIGSFNLDRWSFQRNLEVSFASIDAGIARRMEEQFFADTAMSHEVKLEDWAGRSLWDRVLGAIAFRLARL